MISRTLLFRFLLVAVVSVLLQSCSDEVNGTYGTCEITGEVLDIDGAAIEGASVGVMIVGEGCYPVKTMTDSDGRFALTVARSTDELLLEVTADGYQPLYRVIIPGYVNAVTGVTLGEASVNVDDLIMVNDR